MIKQLQLRGISRTPSDRAVADGGCAESLNVHLEYNETAPTLKPQVKDVYGNDTNKYPIIYIHKMLGVTNYIGHIVSVSGSNQGFYAYGADLSANAMGGLIVPGGEVVSHITSIGNTLIVFTDKNPYYFLYKEKHYTYLGNSIPRPEVEVISKPAATDMVLVKNIKVAQNLNIVDDMSEWNAAKTVGSEDYDALVGTMQNIWDAVSQEISSQRSQGYFVAPFFLRYALRLYDGSYIYSSTPILCGAGKSADWISAFITKDQYITDDYVGHYANVGLNNIFNVRIRGNQSLASWGDIVKSIDFFASEPIYAPAFNAGFGSIATVWEYHDQYSGLFHWDPGYDITFEGMESSLRNGTIKNAILSKGQFYKIKSIETNNLGSLTDGSMVISAADNVSGDLLYAQEAFPEGYRDGIQYLPLADAQNFNNRLMLVGADEILSRGDMFLNGQMAGKTAGTAYAWNAYRLRFKIVNPINGAVNYVVAHYRDDTMNLKPAYFDGSIQQYGPDTNQSSVYAGDPYSWICYPDTRCKEVELTYWYNGGNNSVTFAIPMEAHPLLECAYAFIGFGRKYSDVSTYDGTHIPTASFDETRKMSNGNKLLLSAFENPFVFPASNIITFNDKLIGVATVSVPLSEGQFGEYPLYAFTEGGIRVLVTTAEGTFAAANAHPNLSRHVALPGTIMGLEQAVVFVTNKGVMLLSGNQVTEISANMNGKPYTLDSETSRLLTGSDWYDLLSAADLLESTATPPVPMPTFMRFMENAKPAYDHNGSRLLFFNNDKSYQYEYRLETQTWHKMLSGVTNGNILNSYPECLISYSPSGVPTVLDFSTVLDDASILYDEPTSGDTRYPIYGIIATRPFDLGEPDVRKSISSIRIRGKYNRADVQYVLLGSFDDIHWQRITSLHGSSYKLFRMVLLTKLNAMERITWIDVEYESRMTNKLR